MNLTARALGRQIARRGFGLVVGGWHGVDYVTADEFAIEMRRQSRPVAAHLIQVVPGGEPKFKGGHVIDVPKGPREWVDPLGYCQAVVLVGGVGGTYEMYHYARQERKPVIPMAPTGGDAERVYKEMLGLWDVDPIKGLSRSAFEGLAARQVGNAADADQLAEHCVNLVDTCLTAAADPVPRVFISYSRKDRGWAEMLVQQLRAEEAAGKIRLWYDGDLEPGARWQDSISGALALAKVVVFLVSPNSIASEFIRKHELAQTIQSNVRALQWALISKCDPPQEFLSREGLHDIRIPLDQLTPAARQEALARMTKAIVEQASGTCP